MKEVKVLVLRTAGTNCDQETAFAFEKAGATTELIHVNRISDKSSILHRFHILAFPGGFTYGDDVASGKILSNEITHKFADEMEQFIAEGKLIIGICNGFQVLVKAGYLPRINGKTDHKATLTYNDCGKFEDRWVCLKTQRSEIRRQRSEKAKCVWTKDLPPIIELPIAHGEGKFVPDSAETLEALWKNDQVVFQYVNKDGHIEGFPCNPNGSVDAIAGICDSTGRIFGLMPHPERHIVKTHHPRWTREKFNGEPAGLTIFKNGVDYAKENLY